MSATASRAPTRYVALTDDPGGLNLYGGNRALWDVTDDHECVLAGAAETGKTFACLLKLHWLLIRFPGTQAVLCRKVRDTIYSTVLQTYLRKIARDFPLRAYGGERPAWFDYPPAPGSRKRSRLWLAGLDDPGKALSSERDFIFVNQAEELTEDDWQVLTTRATGRAGNSPVPLVFGDANPAAAHHWIRHRPSLRLLHSEHRDNPTLWDAAKGDWTEQGRRTLAVLDALTGVRKERLRFGRWVSAEGVVFELDPRRHVLSRAELIARGWLAPDSRPGPAVKLAVGGVDWGFTAPGSLGAWLVDGDGRVCLVREWYATGKLIDWWVERGRRAKVEFGCVPFVCDPARPEFLSEFNRAGLVAVPGDNDRDPGIQAVQARLADAGDGRPRLFVAADALIEPDPDLVAVRQPVGLVQEADALVWAPDRNGRPAKEGATVGPDHGWDMARYVVRYVDRRVRAGSAAPAVGGRTRASGGIP